MVNLVNKKKQYIFTSITIFLFSLLTLFLSLIQVSSISQEIEKEHSGYIKTFTSFYASLIQRNIDKLIDQMDFFVRRVTEEEMTNFDSGIKENITIHKEDLFKGMYNFLYLTDNIDSIEITYITMTHEIWFYKFFYIQSDREMPLRIGFKGNKIQNKEEIAFLEDWRNEKKTNKFSLYLPIIANSKQNKNARILIPITYNLNVGNTNLAKITVYFKTDALTSNTKDFKILSKSSIEELFVIMQGMSAFSIEDVSMLHDFSEEYSFKEGSYPSWPIFNSFDKDLLIRSFESVSSVKNEKSQTFLEMFRIYQTQEFWGVLLKVDHEDFPRLSGNFFKLVSIILLGFAFLFLSSYYMASFFYKENIYKLLEKTSLEKTMQLDALTGTLTRKTFPKIAYSLIENEDFFALGVLDIDFFKKINDNFGHKIGDEVLIDLTRKITEEFKRWEKKYPTSHFYLARWGGEEFIIVLNLKDKNLYKDLIISLQKTISQNHSSKNLPSYTVSIGVTTIEYKERRRDPKEVFKFLFKEADLALYDAKQSGRNKVVFYETNQEDPNNNEDFLLS